MENVYGNHYYRLLAFKDDLERELDKMEQTLEAFYGTNIIDHTMGRLKSENSVLEKCRKKQIDPTPDSIISGIRDLVGIRVICTFVDDTFKVRDAIREFKDIEVIEEKDYISKAKPNGYRSYHMIVRNKEGYYAEIQIRTISMDTWAALEHDIKYKKDINVNKELITAELKRCADELASTDISMQTIRNMIYGQM